MRDIYGGADQEHGAMIDDDNESTVTTWSSNKIQAVIPPLVIDDDNESAVTTWSSTKIQAVIPPLVIDDDNESTLTTWSSSKIQSVVPPIASSSNVLSHTDYSTMYSHNMRAIITSASGGTNTCWGHTATYIAGVPLLAGRVVALMATATDTNEYLKVEYLKTFASTNASIYPIGITQHNAAIGEQITVCILGYTTVITANSLSSPNRGSIVISADAGRMQLHTAPWGNQARLGFVAQSSPISTNNSPVLIYYSGWFQPT
jgi:hypothetical protein